MKTRRNSKEIEICVVYGGVYLLFFLSFEARWIWRWVKKKDLKNGSAKAKQQTLDDEITSAASVFGV